VSVQANDSPTVGGIRIQPIGPTSWDDVADLFGGDGAYAGCWCMFWRQSNQQANAASAADSRSALKQLIGSGQPIGVLAYRNGTPVGWCQVAPRPEFYRLLHTRGLALSDATAGSSVWSIVCVFVERTARGKGVPDALVDGAVTLAREHGATSVEAYPIAEHTNRRSQLSSGTVGLYARAGFRLTEGSSGRRSTMVLALE
jgi:GNAT superfamily N-acetyltransferase